MWGEGGILNYSEGIGENWVLEQSLLKAHKIAVLGGEAGGGGRQLSIRSYVELCWTPMEKMMAWKPNRKQKC